jgi:hypothetical protein
VEVATSSRLNFDEKNIRGSSWGRKAGGKGPFNSLAGEDVVSRPQKRLIGLDQKRQLKLPQKKRRKTVGIGDALRRPLWIA